MTQTGLMESIISDVGLSSDSNMKTTTPRQETWNCQSIIGNLNFLAQNTRPDISFAVHQCAHFCQAPTALHEMAIKRVVCCLIYMKDKGLILHPTKTSP
jgi:hypothetical protein